MSLQIPEHLFTAIDHVGIAVADLDEAMAFYRDTFGMRTVHEETNQDQGVREAMVAVGDSGSCIQLLAPLDGTSTIAKFLDRSGPGLQQLAYRVTDLDAVSAVLRERGVRLLYDEARRGTSDSRTNFVHPKDAGGVLVELVETSASPGQDSSRTRVGGMDPKSLVTLGDEHLELARSAHSGRSSSTVYGDHTHALRQTLIALVSGQSLAEHENPGEATVQVLRGSITLTDSESVQPVSESELLAVPLGRHSLRAETDCVVLLTVAVDLG